MPDALTQSYFESGILTTAPALHSRAVGERAHIPALDGLRGVAIILVLIVHSVSGARGNGRGIEVFNSIVHSGVFGVDLFFVLSGFLITGVLLGSKGSTGYFRTFYIRRVLRLFPVYYAFLVFMMVLPTLHRLAGITVPEFHGSWWWYLLYASNWKANHDSDASLGHFWSLALEEQFYLVWPLAIYFFRARALAWWCAFLAVMAVVLRCELVGKGLDLYANTPFRLDSLSVGALLALAVRNDVWRYRLVRYRPVLSRGCLAGLIIAVLQHWRTPWNGTSAFFAALWFGVLVFQGAVDDLGPGAIQFLNRPWLLRYGRYSYCLYVANLFFLDHGLWLSEYLRRRVPHLIGILLTFLIMAMANVLLYYFARTSWRYFEMPALRLKDRLAPPVTGA